VRWLVLTIAILGSALPATAGTIRPKERKEVQRTSRVTYYAAKGHSVDVKRTEAFLDRLAALFGPTPDGWRVQKEGWIGPYVESASGQPTGPLYWAAGVLALLYLPRFAAAYPSPGLGPVVREAAVVVLLPSAVLFVLLFAFHRPLLAALYVPSFEAPPTAVALLFAGSLARIASWIALFALYAAVRTRAIALGELLSLPLFAALVVVAGDALTLESVGVFWLVAFLAYTAFNSWAVRRA